tara:strand:+ start:2103 stop:2807 length:705 start_codon:yes stop_codon:yes gene_type:complete
MEGLEFIKDSFGQMNGFLTFIIILTIIASYLAVKFKDDLVELVNRKKDKRKIKDLSYHSMFLVCDKVLKRVENIDFTTFSDYDEVKTKLLKKLIQLKIKTVKKRFLELLQNEKLQEMEQPQLKYLVASTLSNLVNEYNNNALRIMNEEMEIEMKDAKFLVDKYEEFREYIVNAFVDELDTIVMDDNYTNNFDRLNTILYTVSISLSIIPRDVVATFNNVNGRFTRYSSANQLQE